MRDKEKTSALVAHLNAAYKETPFKPGLGIQISIGNWGGFRFETGKAARAVRVVCGFGSVHLAAHDLGYSMNVFVDGWVAFRRLWREYRRLSPNGCSGVES